MDPNLPQQSPQATPPPQAAQPAAGPDGGEGRGVPPEGTARVSGPGEG